ncbi:MAG: hypothetical protein DRQ55_07190 [Planctomycetota bacterium]|nr:MAG: hypothetical protein DRQ55_07190 [Planctomycetota bacterium]
MRQVRRHALATAAAIALLLSATRAQIVWQTGIGPAATLHHVGPGADILARGTSTKSADTHTLFVPEPAGEVVHRLIVWSFRTDHLPPSTDSLLVDGHAVFGTLCADASPPPQWNKLMLAVYVGLVPVDVTPGHVWTIDGAGHKPLGDEPWALGEALTVVLITDLDGFPERSVDFWCGYASTESDSWTPGLARAELDLSTTYPGGGLHLIMDALDGEADDGSGAGTDALVVGSGPAGGVLSGTGTPNDSWQGSGPGPGPYDLLDDDPTLAALVLAGANELTITTQRLLPLGDSVGHCVVAVSFPTAAGPWTTAGPNSAPPRLLPPLLAPTGSLAPGSANTLLVAGATACSAVFLVVGASALLQPFKGGVLGPQPTLLLSLSSDASGRAELAFVGPSVPAGLLIWAQAWVPPGTGWSSSMTLRGLTP